MFRWIIFARRPLKVDELREAIAFDINDTEWDHAKIPSELLRLIRACGNLILINHETQEVQLAHYTVEQYLLDRNEKCQTYFHITKEESNWKLAQICVAYLSFSDFGTQIIPYSDTTTPKFAPLENAVANQSLLPLGTVAVAAVRIITKFRGEKRVPTNVEYARHLPNLGPRNAPITLTEKYRLLSYVIDNWLWHSECFTRGELWASNDLRERLLFEKLAVDKSLLFQFRPWEMIPVRRDLPYLVQLGWAISATHLPLLEILLTKDRVDRYLAFAAKACWQEDQLRDSNIPHDLLRAWRTYPLDISRNVGDWGTWLYCQILRAARDGNFEIIRMCFKHDNQLLEFQPWVERLMSHVILEAAISGQEKIVAWLCSSKSYSVWLACGHLESGLPIHFGCNAIEHAALQGFGSIIDILLPACPISESFTHAVLIGGILKRRVRARNISKLKCLLKVLPKPTITEARSKSTSPGPLAPLTSLQPSHVKPGRLRFFSRSSVAKKSASEVLEIVSESNSKDLYICKLRAVLTAAFLGDADALAELLHSQVSAYEDKATAINEHHGALLCATANDHADTVKYVLASGRARFQSNFLPGGFAGPPHDKTHSEYLAFIPTLKLDDHDRSILQFAIRLARTDESGKRYQEIIDILLGFERPIIPSHEQIVWLEREAISRQRNDRLIWLRDFKDPRIPPQSNVAPQSRRDGAFRLPIWGIMLIYPICSAAIWVFLFCSILYLLVSRCLNIHWRNDKL